MKRKHTLVITLTFEEPCTGKIAVRAMDMIIENSLSDWMSRIVTWGIKDEARVFPALRSQRSRIQRIKDIFK